MRNRVLTVTAALLLASATFAMAQTKPAEATSGTTAGAATGTVDVGFRGTSASGDEARYERYRDLRDGVYTNIVFGKQTDSYLFDVTAKNIGYRDQNYTARLPEQQGDVLVRVRLDPAELLLQLPDAVGGNRGEFVGRSTMRPSRPCRTAAATRRPSSPLPPGFVAIPANAAQASSRRCTAAWRSRSRSSSAATPPGFNLGYDMTTDVALTVGFTTTKKTGYQPFGMSFAFNNANELPMQLDNRTNDFGAAVEWVKPQGMFRAAFDYSMFSNKFNEVEWDNPLQLVDYNNGLVPPTGPYDPSGYSNGNGAARGRISSFPDNTMSVVSFMGLYKFNRATPR